MNYYGKSKQVLQQIIDSFKAGTVPAALAQRFISRKDDKPSKNLSTWAHELVHAADYKNGTLNLEDRSGNEVVAELGGAALLLTIGQKTEADLGGAWNYIKSYSSAEQDKAIAACNRLLKRVMANVNAIMDAAEQIKTADKNMKKAA